MAHPHPLKKYLKIINNATYVLMFIGLIQGVSIYQNSNKNEKLLDSISSNRSQNNNIFNDYNFTSPTDTDFSLALVDIVKNKSNFIYLDVDKKSYNSQILDYAGTHKNNLFKDAQLTEESKLVYQNFKKSISQPISKEKIDNARQSLKKGELMLEIIDKQKSLSPSFKQTFKNNLNELSILVKLDSSIEINNIYKENFNNEKFQNLLERQDSASLWKEYFEDKFGKDISPIAYLQDGSFHKMRGIE